MNCGLKCIIYSSPGCLSIIPESFQQIIAQADLFHWTNVYGKSKKNQSSTIKVPTEKSLQFPAKINTSGSKTLPRFISFYTDYD